MAITVWNMMSQERHHSVSIAAAAADIAGAAAAARSAKAAASLDEALLARILHFGFSKEWAERCFVSYASHACPAVRFRVPACEVDALFSLHEIIMHAWFYLGYAYRALKMSGLKRQQPEAPATSTLGQKEEEGRQRMSAALDWLCINAPMEARGPRPLPAVPHVDLNVSMRDISFGVSAGTPVSVSLNIGFPGRGHRPGWRLGRRRTRGRSGGARRLCGRAVASGPSAEGPCQGGGFAREASDATGLDGVWVRRLTRPAPYLFFGT